MKYLISVQKIKDSGLSISIRTDKNKLVQKTNKSFSKLMHDLKPKLDTKRKSIYFVDVKGPEVERIKEAIKNVNLAIIEV